MPAVAGNLELFSVRSVEQEAGDFLPRLIGVVELGDFLGLAEAGTI